ncbi:glutaredoxin-like protein C5orf63 homolog isoform X4 [Pan paniscus]|uniref:glutaredoxin-like protein C5orf63 homolog isoform X4 n=1 Tax=Pan paniscus TaxID=9597 RepID=UPI0015602466|nr:glutaredoxin-like protein C5orf63 homolog isoform X4 [Pan paniscus]
MVPKHAGSLFRVLFFSLALVCVSLFTSKGSGAATLESVDGTPPEIERPAAVLPAWGGSAGRGAGAWWVRAEVPGAGRKQRRWRREAQDYTSEEAKSQLEYFLNTVLILFAIISKGRNHLDQDPCPLCDEAKEVLKPYENRFAPMCFHVTHHHTFPVPVTKTFLS